MKKNNRGLPSVEHENKIEEFIAKGFKRAGFCSWLKSLGLRACLGDSADREEFCPQRNYIGFTDGLSNARKMKTKRTIASLQRLIPAYVDYDNGEELTENQFQEIEDCYKDCFSKPRINFESIYLYTGLSELDPSNLYEMTATLTAIPDCWRYNHENKTVEIIEVTDWCRLTYNRLKKYAAIEDLLWCWAGIRMTLTEINLKGGTVVHDTCFIYNMSLDVGDIYSEPDDDNDALKWYYSALADENAFWIKYA